jgi:hypothetical protein
MDGLELVEGGRDLLVALSGPAGGAVLPRPAQGYEVVDLHGPARRFPTGEVVAPARIDVGQRPVATVQSGFAPVLVIAMRSPASTSFHWSHP